MSFLIKSLKMIIKCVIEKFVVGGMRGYKVVISSFPNNDGIGCTCKYSRILEGNNLIYFPLKCMFKNHMHILDLIKVVISICAKIPSVSYSHTSIEGKGKNLIMNIYVCKIHYDSWGSGNERLASLTRNFSNRISIVGLSFVWVVSVGFSQGRK